MQKKAIIIGAGFSGLAAASCLAQAGLDVTVLEKNDAPGGRARKLEAQGFTFDMGPSWYWMPDVFEEFFARFQKSPSDYYQLLRLDPSYRIFFGNTQPDGAQEPLDVPAGVDALCRMFEQIEPGSSVKLQKFLAEGRYKYEVGMREFVHKPCLSLLEFADWRIVKSAFRLQLFQSLSSQVRKMFKHKKLVQLLEFPVLFLGASPEKTPAMYSLMNYADMALGTWYPLGGICKVVEGMASLAQELGAKIELRQAAKQIVVENGKATKVITETGEWAADFVVGSADYFHVEQNLLTPQHRMYSQSYWQQRVMAPSCALFYLGINKKLVNLEHHNLFFDRDFRQHAVEIYERPAWAKEPLFYVCAPSVTDPSVAPQSCENLFVLVPQAAGLEDSEEQREACFEQVMSRLEHLTGQAIRPHIVFKRSFAHRDFISEYNAFRGNAYGLANTLRQTAFLKPRLRSRKVSNLFFAGQLTVPGPGVPPALISGQVVAEEVLKALDFKSLKFKKRAALKLETTNT